MLAEIQRLRTYPTPQAPPYPPVPQAEATPIRHTPSPSPGANFDYDMAKVCFVDVPVMSYYVQCVYLYFCSGFQ